MNLLKKILIILATITIIGNVTASQKPTPSLWQRIKNWYVEQQQDFAARQRAEEFRSRGLLEKYRETVARQKIKLDDIHSVDVTPENTLRAFLKDGRKIEIYSNPYSRYYPVAQTTCTYNVHENAESCEKFLGSEKILQENLNTIRRAYWLERTTLWERIKNWKTGPWQHIGIITPLRKPCPYVKGFDEVKR